MTAGGDASAADSDTDSGTEPSYRLAEDIADRLKRTADGLIAAIVQERRTGDVLMMAWMNDEALARTLATREATYWSRSRSELWIKGLTSGHVQYVHEVRLDCDKDAVLLVVEQRGAACHTLTHTCFDTDLLLAPEDGPVAESVPPGVDRGHGAAVQSRRIDLDTPR